MNVWQELRRRRVFRLIGLYIVGAWLAIQVAATFFPAWAIPEAALRYLITAAVIGFPIAVIFGWFFDVTAEGIVRTANASATDPADYSLKRSDYVVLAALAAVSLAVCLRGIRKGTTSNHNRAGSIGKRAQLYCCAAVCKSRR